jgi:hypothetical protein
MDFGVLKDVLIGRRSTRGKAIRNHEWLLFSYALVLLPLLFRLPKTTNSYFRSDI